MDHVRLEFIHLRKYSGAQRQREWNILVQRTWKTEKEGFRKPKLQNDKIFQKWNFNAIPKVDNETGQNIMNNQFQCAIHMSKLECQTTTKIIYTLSLLRFNKEAVIYFKVNPKVCSQQGC